MELGTPKQQSIQVIFAAFAQRLVTSILQPDCWNAMQLINTSMDARARQRYKTLFGTPLEEPWELKASPFSPAVRMLAYDEVGVIGMGKLDSKVY